MLMPSYLLAGEFKQFETDIRNMSSDIMSFKKGEAIISLGAKRPFCYYVIEGLATFSIIHESGRNKTCNFRGNGTIFPLYYGYHATIMEQYMEVRAFTDMETIRLTRNQLHLLMAKYNRFAITMSDCYCKYATMLQYDLSSQMFDNALVKVSNFLYLYLTYMQPVVPNVIELSQEDIGSTIGLSRSNTSRALGVLKNEGIIRNNRGLIQVVNMEKLIEYCSDISFYFSDKDE